MDSGLFIMLKFVACCTLSLLVNVSAYATNAGYITLSNQMARNIELNVVANNVANANTPGYEMDAVIFSPVDQKASKNKTNSFVFPDGSYNSELQGAIKATGAPLDIAVAGNGYFKILTPTGPRYTLNGSMTPNNDGVLVNAQGFPFVSLDNQPIILPEQYQFIEITPDGTVYVDREDIGKIGVFDFPNKFALVKEGNSMYYSKAGDIPIEDAQIITGAIRASNVNAARSMAELVNLQRVTSFNNSLMSDLVSLERNAIQKMVSNK